MTLFPDEKIVSQSNDFSVTLTTHRIYKEVKSIQKSTTQSIMLEHITSCESRTKKSYFWIVLAAFGVLMLFTGEEELMLIGGLLGIIGTVLFFLSRKAFIIVASPSTSIVINVRGMNRSSILNFIDTIEQTKHRRLVLLNKTI